MSPLISWIRCQWLARLISGALIPNPGNRTHHSIVEPIMQVVILREVQSQSDRNILRTNSGFLKNSWIKRNRHRNRTE